MDTTGMEEVTGGEDRGRKRKSEDRKTVMEGGERQTEGKIERGRKRKRYCNGTPRGGRVSGSDIIIVCRSDASSFSPNAKYLLA